MFLLFDICIERESNFINWSTTVIVGFECEAAWLYWCVWVVAVLLQVLRNMIWTRSGQAQRMALHHPIGSPERSAYIRTLLIYTVISMLLYIVSFLLIVGANLGILLAILIGNVSGVYYSMTNQKKDVKSRLEPEMLHMLSDYKTIEDELASKVTLSEEEQTELADLRQLKKELGNFLNHTSPPQQYTSHPAQKASSLQIRRGPYKF